MNNLPLVSIIIPCRNEANRIVPCLDSVLTNDYPRDRLEILVVDGASEDRTGDLVREYSRHNQIIRILYNPRKITPIAFNIGVEHARGEIVMIMSAHATYEPDYVSKCVKYLMEYNADNVGGVMMTVPSQETLMANAIALVLSHPFGAGNSVFRIGSKEPIWVDTVFGGCYRREVFERIGLFNENLVRSQDMEFNIRLKQAGGKILLAPDIVVYYYPKSTLGAFFRHNLSDGVWAIAPLKFGGRLFRPRHLVPLAFVLGLFGSAILIALYAPSFWLFLFILVLYLSTNIYFSARIAMRENNSVLGFVLPVVFAARHVAYGVGSVYALAGVLFSTRFWETLTRRRTTVSASQDSWIIRWSNTMYTLVKRLFDLFFSAFGLLSLSPALFTIALLIKIDSTGPVYFRGERVGKEGVPFRMFKFRTMVVNADRIGPSSTTNDDPRITRVGRFLRKYKLDELPQLINVLKGEMSFVGPRPEVQRFVDMYTEEEKAILTVKPGITDWASLWNVDEGALLAGSVDPDRDYAEKIRPEKIRLQLKYIRERSFGTDLKIIFQTIRAIVSK